MYAAIKFRTATLIYSLSIFGFVCFSPNLQAAESGIRGECSLENAKRIFSIPDVRISFSELKNGYRISFYTNDQMTENDLKSEVKFLLDEKKARTPKLIDGYSLEVENTKQVVAKKSCSFGPAMTEILMLSDVNLSMSPNSSGYDLKVTSSNLYRKPIIKDLVYELLVEKSLATHSSTDGYGLLGH
jgi:hypothetical protein